MEIRFRMRLILLSCTLLVGLLLEACSAVSISSRSAQVSSGKTGMTVTRLNELAAMRKLQAFALVEVNFWAENNRYATFDQLTVNRYLRGDQILLESQGYRFALRVTQDGDDYTAVATPVAYGKTGILSFFIDSKNLVRGADKGGDEATAEDPPAPKPPGSIGENELGAIHKLRAWATAEAMCLAERAQYVTLEQMVRDRILDGAMTTEESEGYRFSLTVGSDFLSFSASAAPITYGETGVHSFFVSENGVVRTADRNGARATASDPPVQ